MQTLEPRAFYVYVPYQRPEQRARCSTRRSTTSTSGNCSRVNRYLGNDRIGDANQLTLALTSRLLDAETGAERLRVARRPALLLPGSARRAERGAALAATSDVLFGVEGRLTEAWALAALWQYNFDSSQTERLTAGVRYTPAPGRVLSANYTYNRQFDRPGRRDQSQIEPVRSRRRVAGRRGHVRCSAAGTTRSSAARRWRRSAASSTMPAAGCCGWSASA